MRKEEFERHVAKHRLMNKTKRALRMVMCEGRTWRDAGRIADVYESTIMRARNRIFPDLLVCDSMPEPPEGLEFLPRGKYKPHKYEGEVGAFIVRKGDSRAAIVKRIVIERSLNAGKNPRPLPLGHGGRGQPVVQPVGGQAKARRRRVEKGGPADSGHRVEAGVSG